MAQLLPSLETLNVSLCEELTELPPSLGFQLEELNVNGCRRIKGIPFEFYATGCMAQMLKQSQAQSDLNSYEFGKIIPTEFPPAANA